jgi:hypothetical protein
MPERTHQPALAVHFKVTRGPHRRQTDIAGKNGVRVREIVERFGDLLWVNEFTAWRTPSQVVKTFARITVVRDGLVEEPAILFRSYQRQQRVDCRGDVANNTMHNWRASAELLRSDVDLDNAGGTSREKLAIREVRTQNQQ